MATLAPPVHRRETTPDSHTFPTRPYDLVKEFVIALTVIVLLTVGLAAIFSSPDESAITMRSWAQAVPDNVVATATAELAGTSESATYGPPYNSNGEGQSVLGIPLQKWGGVRLPVNSQDLVLQPLSLVPNDPQLSAALATWRGATSEQQTAWATAYSNALADAPNGDPNAVAPGDYGPVPAMTTSFLTVAQSGGLEGILSQGDFYGTDPTRGLLLLSDGAYLEDSAVSQQLGGDQWGMMNETGNYPGQPWMWLYTFWYQIKPFSTSENADAQVWAIMLVLTLALMFLPFIPGLRSIPRWVPVHRLIWRQYYRSRDRQARRPG